MTRVSELMYTCTQQIKGTKMKKKLFIFSNPLFIFVFIFISVCYLRVDTRQTNRNKKKTE